MKKPEPLLDLKPGDKICQVELVSEGGDITFRTIELIFDRYINDYVPLDGQKREGVIAASLHKESAPSVKIKADISVGFYRTDREAKYFFVSMLQSLYLEAKEQYEEEYEEPFI